MSRLGALAISNVSVFNGDMKDITLSFNVGIGLHFCGMLTDLALDLCFQREAAYVFCPCCYGKV